MKSWVVLGLLACAVLFLSGCIQVVKNESSAAGPEKSLPPAQPGDAAKAQSKAPVTAAKQRPAPNRDNGPAPLDLTKVDRESGITPPPLPNPSQEGLP